MGLGAGLEEQGKSRRHRDSITRHPARSGLLYRLRYPSRSPIYMYMYLPLCFYGSMYVITPLSLCLSVCVSCSRVCLDQSGLSACLIYLICQLSVMFSDYLKQNTKFSEVLTRPWRGLFLALDESHLYHTSLRSILM